MLRILIADDHPMIIWGIEAVLNDSQYEVVAAVRDGLEACRIVEEVPADILILDFKMPKMNGLEVLREIRAAKEHLKVVLLTAELNDEELLEAVRLGVDGVLLKEVAQEQLIECLDQVSAGRKWIVSDLLQRALQKTFEQGAIVATPSARLSPKELSIIDRVAQGMPNRDIAEELGMPEGTVKVYLSRIYRRIGVKNRTELALLAERGAVTTG